MHNLAHSASFHSLVKNAPSKPGIKPPVDRAQAAGRLPATPTATLTGLIFATVHGLLDLRSGGRLRFEKGFSDVLSGATLRLDLIGSKPQF